MSYKYIFNRADIITDDFISFIKVDLGFRLYMEGYDTNIQVLYPKIEMPVSTGTPFLSHFVKWAHSEKWYEFFTKCYLNTSIFTCST